MIFSKGKIKVGDMSAEKLLCQQKKNSVQRKKHTL